MPHPELVTARDLERRADALAARSVLPRLVRRLILANAAVTQIVMRAGEGTGIRGWDGLVEASVGDAHVPLGRRAAAMLRRIADSDDEWARRQDDQSSHILDRG